MEKKKFDWKKSIIIMVVFLLLPFLPIIITLMLQRTKTVEFGTSGIYQEEEVKKVSQEIIHLFTTKSYQEVMDNYAVEGAGTEKNVENIKNAAIEIGEDWGEYKDVTYVELSELKQRKDYYASLEAEAVYENVTVTFKFIFDDEMKLAGLDLQDSAAAEE